jgi:hypothetical protein
MTDKRDGKSLHSPTYPNGGGNDDPTLSGDTYSINKNEAAIDGVDPIYAAKARVLNAAIQEIGMGKYQWQLFFVIGFGWAQDNLWPIVSLIDKYTSPFPASYLWPYALSVLPSRSHADAIQVTYDPRCHDMLKSL